MIKPMVWRLLALAATFAVGCVSPVQAQLVIGDVSQPSVVIDWSVMDRLGQQPSLADMLKPELPGKRAAVRGPAQPNGRAAANNGAGGRSVNYTPYKPGASRKNGAAAAQPGKFVPYQPGVRATPSEAATSYQPGKFVPYRPVTANAAAKPAAKPVTTKPVTAKPVVETTAAGMNDFKAEVKKATMTKVAAAPVSVPAPPAPVSAPAVTAAAPLPAAVAPVIDSPAKSVAKMPEPASLKAVEEVIKPVAAVKSEVPLVVASAPPVAAVAPTPLVSAAPAVVASAGPVVALPSIVTPPPPAPVSVVSAEPVRSVASSVSLGWKGDTLVMPYEGDSSDLSAAVRGELNVLAQRMSKQDALGLQLLAYAEGDDANASKARRLSLTRALEVRKYLMEQGVRSTRIEVRALGNKVEGGGSANRVEAQLVTR